MSSNRDEKETNPLSQSLALQLVSLGMILASKEARKKCDPEDWEYSDMEVVVSEVQHLGGADKAYAYLKRWLLEICGVDWKQPKMQPVDAILAKLRRDGVKGRVIDELGRMKEGNFLTLDMNLDQFFQCIARAFHAAEPEVKEWYQEEFGDDQGGGTEVCGGERLPPGVDD